ncbi:hypothetical protein [Alkalicoccobacillus murimartini]|uniref:Uncharacterized protein n=1 Tax=Alkalicoccobacillus murimartini TaxID=171685 RepID=A0ABT9YLF6_9BACI|nr:hypothetical protein [Alkalicoccobacillus murimartini]MDQ0208321.1 hypothetical protein [Alkalicoccobacillus murimartini]
MNRKEEKRQAGELLFSKSKKLFALIEDLDERYPYLLLCLTNLEIVQYYDDLPTNEEISIDIEDEIESVHHHKYSKITIA